MLLTSNTEVEAHKDAMRELYKNYLYATAKNLLGFKDLTKRTHSGTIEALQSPTTRKLIILPRGTFKSSLCCVAYPIWCLIRNPNLRILIDSELVTNSSTFLREIKGHLENPEVTDLFGTFKTRENWTQESITIAQRTKTKKESSITCGGVGTTKVGQHYDIIIGDDYNSPTNSDTPEGLEKIIRHYRYNQSILDPGGIYIIVGTRYAQRDIEGFILEEELGLKLEDQKSGSYDTNAVTTGLI